MDLTNMLMGLEDRDTKSRDKILRAPFGYPGGKSRSVKHILPHLPHTDRYVEPFGGSGAILLARDMSTMEVFNDRYSGVTCFYRCLRDPKMYKQLTDRLDLTVHSREEFVWCKDTWEDCSDPVERAARWYYHVRTSFGSIGRHFGRSTSRRSIIAGKIQLSLKHFQSIHQRLHRVQIENQDWEQCMKDYDHPDTVFYLDPPYVDASPGMYKHELSVGRHEDLLERIFSTKGFVALSGYPNPLYSNRDWDDCYNWDVHVSAKSLNTSEGGKRDHLGHEERGKAGECLWIKEAQ